MQSQDFNVYQTRLINYFSLVFTNNLLQPYEDSGSAGYTSSSLNGGGLIFICFDFGYEQAVPA